MTEYTKLNNFLHNVRYCPECGASWWTTAQANSSCSATTSKARNGPRNDSGSCSTFGTAAQRSSRASSFASSWTTIVQKQRSQASHFLDGCARRRILSRFRSGKVRWISVLLLYFSEVLLNLFFIKLLFYFLKQGHNFEPCVLKDLLKLQGTRPT